jgi:hypothetical protein
MTDPAILFVKPDAISVDDKATLKAAGVLVVEIDDPASAKFTRAAAEVESTEMLRVAAKAIRSSEIATKEFGELMCKLLTASHQ